MGGFTDALFVILSGTLVFLSIAVVVMRNPVRATFLLIFSFVPTAGLYIILHAPFVSVLQILVYSGAILVLFTFVVMMINPAPFVSEEEAKREKATGLQKSVMGIVAIAATALTISFVNTTITDAGHGPEKTDAFAAQMDPDFGSIASIGELLFKDPLNSPYFLSFQLMAFLILAGIVAAVNLSRGPRLNNK
ncbi:MAG: NADH-quinone oxidoreductase subunit J [bacterium]|nr:NADH-quinone oxidoreductase subunit J [bacterium]